jgi:ABC-type antimicrobial peptide transport system permease subunit
LTTLNDIIKKSENNYVTLNNIALILTVFFLINLCLGVVGTFWLQTRSRVEEMGVLRTFGATKWNIRAMLLGEGFVLSTLAVFVGCMLYLQIALRTEFVGTKLAMSLAYHNETNLMDSWILYFGEHFMVVSLLCYAVITITVLVGIYIPAHSISNVNPIDALRDE